MTVGHSRVGRPMVRGANSMGKRPRTSKRSRGVTPDWHRPASAAVVVATYVALFGSSLTQRVTIGTAMALWFIGVLWIGVPGNISTPLLGAAVLIPVAVFSVIGFGSFTSRSWLHSAPLPELIALQATRVLGVLFVLLLSGKRL